MEPSLAGIAMVAGMVAPVSASITRPAIVGGRAAAAARRNRKTRRADLRVSAIGIRPAHKSIIWILGHATMMLRRDLLKTSAAWTAASSSRVFGANERIRIAGLGVGGRATYLLGLAAKADTAEIVARCNVSKIRLAVV